MTLLSPQNDKNAALCEGAYLMNESRSAGRPARPVNSTHSARRSPQSADTVRRRRRRRRRRSRSVSIFLLVHQVLLILLAFGIGHFFGVRAGKAAAEPIETQLPAVSDPVESTAGPVDTTAPQIMGVNKLSMFLGGTIAYRSGILVVDDTDPAPQLTVDNSQVDLSTPGTYPVVYTATDSAGNFTSVATTVTVSEAPDTYVDEAIIKDTADQLLAKIVTDDMTKEEQVNAIYDYIESHCYYIAEFDKTDYMQAAYLMMTNNRGDCFGFYALSRLLFDRLGLENLSVTRLKNEVRTSSHYWNMVSLDGGETWYHFDATPHMTYPTRTCLVTDADLEAFNELMPNYYYFDHAAFPKTPETGLS